MNKSGKFEASQVECISRKLFSWYHQTVPLADGNVTKVRNPPRSETGLRISDWTHCGPCEGYKLSIFVCVCTRCADTVLFNLTTWNLIDGFFYVCSIDMFDVISWQLQQLLRSVWNSPWSRQGGHPSTASSWWDRHSLRTSFGADACAGVLDFWWRRWGSAMDIIWRLQVCNKHVSNTNRKVMKNEKISELWRIGGLVMCFLNPPKLAMDLALDRWSSWNSPMLKRCHDVATNTSGVQTFCPIGWQYDLGANGQGCHWSCHRKGAHVCPNSAVCNTNCTSHHGHHHAGRLRCRPWWCLMWSQCQLEVKSTWVQTCGRKDLGVMFGLLFDTLCPGEVCFRPYFDRTSLLQFQDSCTATQEGCWSQPSSTSTSIGNCARESKICNWTSRRRFYQMVPDAIWNLILWFVMCDLFVHWFVIFVTCARWAPPLIQQAEHWRLCKSHLVFGFLEVKTNLICPESKCDSAAPLQVSNLWTCVFCVPKAHRKGPLGLKVRVADDEWHSSVAEGSSPAWTASDHHCFWYYDMRQTLGSGRRSQVTVFLNVDICWCQLYTKCWY